MLIIEDVEIKWTPSNKRHYESLGYKYEYRGELSVKTNELPPGCHKKVKIQCEYCNKIFKRIYKDYLTRKRNHIIDKDSCSECYQIKVKETKNILTDKNPNYYKEIWDKSHQTMENLYGVRNPMELDEFKEKLIQTNIERYDSPYFVISDNYMNNIDEIQSKIRKTLFENETGPSSSQQIYLNNLLNGKLNYPIKKLSLDIAFPDEKIYIEYNGSGHWLSIHFGDVSEEEFEFNEMKRWYVMKNRGWKQICIQSIKDYLPLDKVIIHMINESKLLLNKGRTWVRYDIDKGTIETSQETKLYDFGVLRKISKNDISA